MPMDGITIAGVINELREKIVNGRVDKITQPETDEIVLQIRGKGENYKLLLTANASAPRLHLTTQAKTSPLQAPMFCMVLRKYLSGGRLLDIRQPDFERIVEFWIESFNEMGDLSVKKLVIEIMGKHSNIMLLDESDMILDSAKHISKDTSSVREVLPGKPYERPPSKGKISPIDAKESSFYALLQEKRTTKIQQVLYQSYNGISPVMGSELCVRANVAADCFAGELTEERRTRLFNAFQKLFEALENKADGKIYYDANGKASDFSTATLQVYPYHRVETYASPSAMLESYFGQKDATYRMGQKTADIKKLLDGLMGRCLKKSEIYTQTLAQIKDRDILRHYGELLTAYIYAVEKGADRFVAQDFYNDGALVTINLDPTKTPSENAQHYFKQYNKQKRTFAALQEQVRQNDRELSYLESVAASIQTAFDESDIADIRNELAEQGFLKKRRNKMDKHQKKSKPLHYVSTDGFDIYVGKNNTQNDELTLRFAQASDIWLHTKDIAGSHVIIKTNGQTPTDETLRQAANLAAYHSKGRASSQVPVDYALKKHVRKPNAAKPGFVLYDNHKTLYVTPMEPSLEKV